MATYNKKLAEASNGSLHVVIDGELHIIPQEETMLYKRIVELEKKLEKLETKRVEPHENLLNKIVSILKRKGVWINE